MKKYKPLIIGTIIVGIGLLAVLNADVIFNILKKIFSALMPLFVGGLIALVLNPLFKLIEEKLFKNVMQKKMIKLKRPISLLLSYLVFFGILFGVVFLIVPSFISSINGFVDSIDETLEKIMNGKNELLKKIIQGFAGTDIQASVASIAERITPSIMNITKNVIRGAVNALLGTVISVYILYNKELLGRQFLKILSATLDEKKERKFIKLAGIFGKKFSGFMSGQILEALLLGICCYLGMSAFKIPYAPMVSVLIGISNLIPIIGGYISGVPSAIIIYMVSPIKAVIFIIFICVLQQVESVTTYPKIVGKTVGLSGLWILVAVTVFGALFGFWGVLFGVPITAGLYKVLKAAIDMRLKEKSLDPSLTLVDIDKRFD